MRDNIDYYLPGSLERGQHVLNSEHRTQCQNLSMLLVTNTVSKSKHSSVFQKPGALTTSRGSLNLGNQINSINEGTSAVAKVSIGRHLPDDVSHGG